MKKKQVTSLALAAMTLATMAPATIANAGTQTGPADADAPLGRYSVGDLIKTNDFDDGVGLPWNQVETYPADGDFTIENGKYNVTVNTSDTDRWGVQFRHRGLTLEAGHTYNVQFEITANADCRVYAKIGDQGDPYGEYWNNNWNPFTLTKGQTLKVNQTFTMNQTKDACEMAFHLTGDCAASSTPWTVSLDNVHIYDSQFKGYPIEPEEPTNAIAVNQVGYFPKANKIATLDSESSSPVAWRLLNSAGTVVKSGMTTVKGNDVASGDNIHLIDFSDYQTVGEGYKLEVDSSAVDSSKHDSNQSMEFKIGDDLYTDMKYDAIKYFYHNRSGIDIIMPYADSEELTRGAGHRSDILPNFANTWYTQETGANYSLDISGGWYDAGDHGKYVVNGGISTWTMQNQYERAYYREKDLLKGVPFADNTMNIPESHNGIPDIMDESRYNLQTLLKMQIPDGTNKYAGMVHHKAHDEFWTALAIKPEDDPQRRFLQPPSTAATLNLAAIAAQGSRMWKEYDSSFADQCLTAAEKAWDAAVAHPDVFAPITGGSGGGAYGDDKVTDEFYWAACELYATTGKDKYLNYLKSSEYYLKMPTTLTGGEDKGLSGVFDWGNVQGLGTITLATVPNNLGESEIQKAKQNILAAADTLIANENSEGYGTPMKSTTINGVANAYPWGSNSFVANQAIVMAYANDFAKDLGLNTSKYIDGAARAMNYLLGNNPMEQSYVTGYGSNPLENPHHRFWSYQADNNFPKAPAGCMSGGPNSGLEDPWVKGSGWHVGDMSAAKCFMDNIESWSTNEITINWNAPFAWITSYMDDHTEDYGKGDPIDPIDPEQPTLLGDVNKDGKVTIKDYVKLQKYVMNPSAVEINTANADMNKDGKINVTDVMLLKKALLA